MPMPTPDAGDGGEGAQDALLPAADANAAAARKVLLQFVLFSLCFSTNHGTINASIPLASSNFGDRLGDYSVGTLYLLYTVTALLGALPLVNRLGTKWALVTGLGLYSTYVGGYLVGMFTDGAARWVVVLAGGALGGVAAGVIWPAQGQYFARCSAVHAALLRHDPAKSTSMMSGIFATVYLGLEVTCRVLASLIQNWVCFNHWRHDFITGSCGDDSGSGSGSEAGLKHTADVTVYLVYFAAAIIATVLMAICPLPEELAEEVNEDPDSPSGVKRVLSPRESTKGGKETSYNIIYRTLDLMRRDRKVLLMMGVNCNFAIALTFALSYVTGTVIKDSLGDGKIGLFTAIGPLTAMAVSMPCSWLVNRIGDKRLPMLVGQLCFGTFCLCFALSSDPTNSLGKWSVLPPLFIIFGVGRGAWEGPNKGVFADFFQGEDAGPGFSNLVFQNGLFSTIAFFVFPSIGSKTKAWAGVVCSVLAIVGYLAADGIHRREVAEVAEAAAAADEDGEACVAVLPPHADVVNAVK